MEFRVFDRLLQDRLFQIYPSAKSTLALLILLLVAFFLPV